MANVSVSNTPGLYIGSGASNILNNAQQLLTLLSNQGNVNFALASGNTTVQGFFVGNIPATYSNANVAAYLPVNSSNVAGSYFIGNGSKLTNLPVQAGTYTNANVAAYLPTFDGNIGQPAQRPFFVYSSFFVGDGSGLTNLPGTSTYGNANVAAFLPTNTSNVAATYFIGDGSQLTNLPIPGVYGNANVAAYLLTSTGNISAGYFLGDGSKLTNLPSTSNYGNANVAAYLPTYTGTLDNSSTIVTLTANAASQALDINTLFGSITTLSNGQTAANTNISTTQANLGAFQTYANTRFSTIDANLGTATNNITTLFSNAAAQATSIDTINANLGTATNNITTLFSNAGTQATSINTLNANLGAFQTYANTTFGTSNYSNVNVAAYLPTYTGTLALSSTIVDLYSNAATQQTQINTLNANVGTLSLGNTEIFANVGNLSSTVANTQGLLSSFTNYANIAFNFYDDTNVSNFLPVYNGNIIVYDEFVSNTLSVQGYSISTFAFTSNSSWTVPSGNTIVSARALIIGGGGGGGTATNSRSGGGGGAGGVLANVNITNSITPGSTYTITVGSGGIGNTSNVQLARGKSSSAFGFTANGGGYGGGSTISINGGRGGSGGGGYGLEYSTGLAGQGGGNSPTGQGTSGGAGSPNYGNPYLGALDAIGGDGGTLFNGIGNFYVDNITGVAVPYAYPGPGCSFTTTSGNSRTWSDFGNTNIANPTVSRVSTQPATPAVFGSGGAGGGGTGTLTGKDGASGVVIVQLIQRGAGLGTIINNNTIITGNISASRVASTNGYFWANGTAYSTGSGTYGNTEVAAYLLTSTGNIAGNSVSLTFNSSANRFVSTTGYFWANGTAYSTGGGTYGNTEVAAFLPTYTGTVGAGAVSSINTLTLSTPGNEMSLNTGTYAGGFSNYAINLNSTNVVTAANLSVGGNVITTFDSIANRYRSTNGYFWANGTAYSTGGGGTYGNTEVAAYLLTSTGNIAGNSVSLTFNSSANRFVSTTGYFWSNGTAYSTGGGGGSDFTSNLTINGNYILNGNINLIREQFANIGTLNGVTTINANTAMIQAAAVASNITINTNNLSNFITGQTITLKLTQATNANLRILTSNILFAGGSKTLSTANAAIDTLSITFDGEQYLGALVKGYS